MSGEKSSTTLFRSFSRVFGKKGPRSPEEFVAVFEQFKNLLDSNNHALEAITDIGDKLGGDYLFDIVYLRNAYARLRADMEQSLGNFDELTKRGYPRLREVFQKIDAQISRMLSDLPVPAGSLVIPLGDIPWGSGRDVGRKMAQVAEVKNQLGLPVPEGFVVTTAAFDEFVRFNHLEDRIRRLSETTSTEYDRNDLEDLILQGAMPPELSRAIRDVMNRIVRSQDAPLLAIRSSAEEEDGSHSFAGQFRTLLGVPFDQREVERAYRKVIASLYSDKAVAYQQQMGYTVGMMKMAVGCMVMVDAASSGVLYSTTTEGDAGTMMISAAWGLGESVVEAGSGSDLYLVRKGHDPEPAQTTIRRKDSMIVAGTQGGTIQVPVPEDAANKACLSPEQMKALAMMAMQIERYFGNPRDIEWAIDGRGTISILQARPLKIRDRESEVMPAFFGTAQPGLDHPILVSGQGLVVQTGTGSGKVFIASRPTDILSMPKGSVLVASHDSSLFVRSMPYVSAIITERGSQTSHMASLCRELKVPTIVNMPKAMERLKQGQEVTIVADPEGTIIYNGIIAELVLNDGQGRRQMEQLYEYRKKRSILRDLSPLHLIDPLMDEFTPERCRTMHDILRFMHEKSVAELVENGRTSSRSRSRRRSVVPLDLPVPAGLVIMDMGGGLQDTRPGRNAGFEQIASIPFKAIVRGMLHPGVWRAEPIDLKTGDFISSMIRMPDIADVAGSTAGYNIAVISRDYMNMSIRFGYHYNMIDCYCSDTAKNNHLFFRFSGGATDLVKRSRRLDLIDRILTSFGFIVRIQGDILTGRLAGLPREQMEQVLERTGRLIAYARQLDAVLHDDSAVERYGKRFLEGTYGL